MKAVLVGVLCVCGLAGIVLAIVLPIVLTRHHDHYCSDHTGWKTGEPLSKCKTPFVTSYLPRQYPPGPGL